MQEEGSALEQPVQRVGQEQIHHLLFGEQLSWQSIIYDLINTEQLKPWDIDISLLAQKFLERVRALEEANFFISSKVLLAAALLLRMKSEILLEHDLPGLDEILFGKKETRPPYVQERITLDDAIPELVARTPLPRFKRVTLEELMQALGHAIKTENRRIKRIVVARQQEYETALSLPKQRINLKERLQAVYAQLQAIFASRRERLAFSEFAGASSAERIATFIPLLHLDHQKKVWLEQEGAFSEIWILLQHLYEEQHGAQLEQMRQEAEAALKELTEEEQERAEKLEGEFSDPLKEEEE